MSNISSLKTYPWRALVWICLVLALLTALAYLLIALGYLSIGNSSATAGDGSIIFVAAGCYFMEVFLSSSNAAGCGLLDS